MGADENLKKNRVSLMVNKGKSMGMLAGKSMEKFTGMKSMTMMRTRKMSYGFGNIAGIGAIDTTAHLAIEYKRPPLLYLATYQLDPHPNEAFNVERVTRMANKVLDDLWNGHKYNMAASPALALRVADEMLRKVKLMSFNRYRIISVVTISEKKFQSYSNAITFLWDDERDRYVNFQRECITNFIQVTIFAIYLD